MHGTTVIVPLDRTASDFGMLMEAALEAIMSLTSNTWQRAVEPRLGLAASDAFSFRKETSAPQGLIAWNDGKELIDSARRTLIAGAKAHIEPSRHFLNRFGQFANRYLGQILMGQSAIGSYIVTAFRTRRSEGVYSQEGRRRPGGGRHGRRPSPLPGTARL